MREDTLYRDGLGLVVDAFLGQKRIEFQADMGVELAGRLRSYVELLSFFNRCFPMSRPALGVLRPSPP